MSESIKRDESVTLDLDKLLFDGLSTRQKEEVLRHRILSVENIDDILLAIGHDDEGAILRYGKVPVRADVSDVTRFLTITTPYGPITLTDEKPNEDDYLISARKAG